MWRILFARVDDRLIHGQVMTQWVKGFPSCEAIVIIDKVLANDEYMKNVCKMAAPSEILVEVLSIDEAIKEFPKDEPKERRVFLLFKDVASVKEAIIKGLPIKSLDIGGSAKAPGKKVIIPSVSLSDEEMEMLRTLNQDFGVEIYFQMVPTNAKFSLSHAISLFGLQQLKKIT